MDTKNTKRYDKHGKYLFIFTRELVEGLASALLLFLLLFKSHYTVYPDHLK
jgi:hypothetical protein